MPRLPGDIPAPKAALITLAAWAISIFALVSGLLAITTKGDPLLPLTFTVAGALGLGVAMARLRWSRTSLGGLYFDQRGTVDSGLWPYAPHTLWSASRSEPSSRRPCCHFGDSRSAAIEEMSAAMMPRPAMP
jgi:hypothetical protein